jgi:hypothetical protein
VQLSVEVASKALDVCEDWFFRIGIFT